MASPADPNRATNDLLRRVPPHSVEAEQAVLGGIFIRNSVFHTLVDTLSSDDFYLPAHQTLYTCFLELYRKNAPIDLVSVASYLKDHGQLEAVGGAAYLSELAQTVVSGANAEYYSTIVRDKSLQRSLIGACSDIISNCFDQSRSVDALLDESEQAVFSISERTSGKVFKSSKELVNRVFEELTKRFEQKEAVTGVTTGYNRLDQMTAGLQPSDLIIVAARPSMGKTSFAMNIAEYAGLSLKMPVAVFSMEMSSTQLAKRLISSVGRIDAQKMRRGRLDDSDWARYTDTVSLMSKSPFYIDDTGALTVNELRSRARRLARKTGPLALIVVDYLQLMTGSNTRGNQENRATEISEISRGLKSLAKEMDVPVIALSQLNRGVDARTDKRPVMSDLRESGAIEQDADIIMFIYRDWVYHKDTADPNVAEIIIGKQRNGPTGTVNMRFDGQFTRFDNLAQDVDVPPEFS